MESTRTPKEYLHIFFELLISSFFIAIYALFCNARAGWFFLAVLILSPLISISSCALFASIISLELSEGGSPGDKRVMGQPYRKAASHRDRGVTLRKNDHASLGLTASNPFILPSVKLIVNLKNSPAIVPLKSRLEFSLWGRSAAAIGIDFKAEFPGAAQAGIDSAYAEDFFNIVRFPLRKMPETVSFLYGILPEIPDLSADTDIIEEAAAASRENQDQESESANRISRSGIPGFEYRKYMPGDPLKRINSKLSARIGELLVRLDQEMTSGKITIWIDNSPPEKYENYYPAREALLEKAVGIGHALIYMGLRADYIYMRSEIEGWLEANVSRDTDLIEVQNDLAYFDFLPKERLAAKRLPEAALLQSAGGLICLSCSPDQKLALAIESIAQNAKAAIFDVTQESLL